MIRTLRPALPCILAVALALATVPALAHENNNHGTIKVHDEAVASPPQRNEPHVDCDFYVEGFDMAGPETDGQATLRVTLVFYEWPPTGDKDDVLWSNVTATRETDGGFRFLGGPYMLPTGHYRVEAYVETGKFGMEHQAKSKMFWVECQPEDFTCPPGIELEVEAVDGKFVLTARSGDETDVFNLYRAADGGEFEYVATIGVDEPFTDGDVQVGVSYEYAIALFDEEGGRESDVFCAVVEAGAIPYFPTLIVASLALAGGLGAYVLMRRRA